MEIKGVVLIVGEMVLPLFKVRYIERSGMGNRDHVLDFGHIESELSLIQEYVQMLSR